MEEKTVNTALDGIMPIDEAVQLFEKVSQPPQDAMKYIDAGKLKGKNEINPLWRMKAMTENYGNYGNGWKYEIVERWTEDIEPTKEKIAHCLLFLYTRNRRTGEWNGPSPAIGSSYLIVKDKNGLHGNDNAWASAITDAFGKACKPFGIGYAVYMGKANNYNRQYNNNYNNYGNNNYGNNNWQNNNYQKNNNYQQRYNNNYNNNYNKQYQQPVQPQAPAATAQATPTQPVQQTTQQTANNPAITTPLDAGQPPQDWADDKKKAWYLDGIKKQMTEYGIKNEEMHDIIKNNFFGKEKTAEMTLTEITVLYKNLKYMANLNKQKPNE